MWVIIVRCFQERRLPKLRLLTPLKVRAKAGASHREMIDSHSLIL